MQKPSRVQLRLLPKEVREEILENWDNLTKKSQYLIISMLKNGYEYEQNGIKLALDNNPNFEKDFIKKLEEEDRFEINQLEQQEKIKENSEAESFLNQL